MKFLSHLIRRIRADLAWLARVMDEQIAADRASWESDDSGSAW